MKDQVIDESLDVIGVMNEKIHAQNRLIIFFYSLFFLFMLLVSADYSTLDIFGILNIFGLFSLFGYVLYYNFQQLRIEKAGKRSLPIFTKWQIVLFLLFMLMNMLHALYKLIEVVSVDWYRLPTVVFFVVIVSSVVIILKEIKYLRVNKN